MTASDARTSELAQHLSEVRQRVAAACTAAGRDIDAVTLMVVTKFFPAADVIRLIGLGERIFGESREPEAGRKVAEVRAEIGDLGVPPAFDMIGSVQTKKARTVAAWARCVQSVDRPKLVTALSGGTRAALDSGVRTDPLEVLLQVSLDGDISRGGVVVDELPELAASVTDADALRLRGLMVIAPQSETPEHWMERTARIRERFLSDHPEATELSAGMSGDLEAAITYGSTCVRVGTAIMGDRPVISP